MNPRSSLYETLTRALILESDTTFDGDLDFPSPPLAPNAKAAVLVLINAYNATITLTKRQDHMRKHAGQVAFAGGRQDQSDPSLWHTALREAHEEIGLPLDHALENLGALPQHITITRFAVTPMVAFNPSPFPYIAQGGEVADIFELPIEVIHPSRFQSDSKDYNGVKRSFYVLPHPDFYIWGATARILKSLALRLEQVGYFKV